jgi:hypothetical protein
MRKTMPLSWIPVFAGMTEELRFLPYRLSA